MSLTMGFGPFGHAPAGSFNRQIPHVGLVYIEPFPRRVRGLLEGEVVVDSVRVTLLHEHARLPRYCFPRDDVLPGLLVPSGRRANSPATGAMDLLDLRLGERVVADGALAYAAPPPGAQGLDGLIAFYWAALDGWLEEDEPVIGHPRDPYHRVDALASSRSVRISLDGELIAESARPTIVFETGIMPRWYLAREDVRAELEPGTARTGCAYKGHPVYLSARTPSGLHENVAWSYPEPLPGAAAITGRVAFFDEHVDVEIDGEPRERPRSPWSEPRWWDRIGEFQRTI